jgi:hypothetical protein
VQQALGRLSIAPALDQDVERERMLVDSVPQPMLPPRNVDHNLIAMPLVPGCPKAAADLVGNRLPELQRPLPHGLMADQDPSCGQHLLDHT